MEAISYPFVCVKWYDAESTNEWVDIEETDWSLPLISTVGHLILEDESHVVVALSVDYRNNNCSDAISIPNAWIEDLVFLSV